MNARRLDLIWLLLIAATGVTWWIGERGAAGTVPMLVMLGLAGFKGTLVVLDFMALRRVRLLWPAILLAWLFIVLGVIVAAYLA
jgi:hypothetical protein